MYMCVGKKFLYKEKKNSKYIWTMRYNEIFLEWNI